MPAPGGAAQAVTVRPFAGSDGDRLVRMFARLSTESVYRRFFSVTPTLDGALLRQLTAVDHDAHEAVVALAGDEMVGMAEYVRRAGAPAVAEIAVTVEDGWQRHGVATRLLRELTRLARRRGVTDFTATMLTVNQPALALVHHLAPTATARIEGPELQVTIPLAAA